jgi:Family of unknown function (DUF6065)
MRGSHARLLCYPTGVKRPTIRVAPVERHWMNDISDRFAYRSLPLNIANAHGWQILNPVAFLANWTGESGIDAVRILSVHPEGSRETIIATSHFGAGFLTFSISGLFRTDPGYDLWVSGPVNEFKDAIQPATSIVETDWLPLLSL